MAKVVVVSAYGPGDSEDDKVVMAVCASNTLAEQYITDYISSFDGELFVRDDFEIEEFDVIGM